MLPLDEYEVRQPRFSEEGRHTIGNAIFVAIAAIIIVIILIPVIVGILGDPELRYLAFVAVIGVTALVIIVMTRPKWYDDISFEEEKKGGSDHTATELMLRSAEDGSNFDRTNSVMELRRAFIMRVKNRRRMHPEELEFILTDRRGVQNLTGDMELAELLLMEPRLLALKLNGEKDFISNFSHLVRKVEEWK